MGAVVSLVVMARAGVMIAPLTSRRQRPHHGTEPGSLSMALIAPWCLMAKHREPTLDDAAEAHRSIAELTELRNRGIVIARRNGQSLRAIADAVGISHTMVAKICGEQ